MVKVKVLQDYRDMEKTLLFHKGEVHEVDKTRAEQLVKTGVVQIVKDVQPDTKKEE